ncbi:PepSY domain-containing protein [Aurantimonas sp. A2-1-M11]|uniref:PepSY domain-containing protein n=1 Tax=Aurantimonas sp. A2-1-M11 TaxID=3113712 RepID=UPI002F91C138
MTATTPVLSQSIQIGPDGIRVVPQEQMRRDDRERRDHRDDRGANRREVSERDAVRIAKRQGMRRVDQVSRSRGAYRVEGGDRRDRRMRVEIDRRSGDVLSVR